MNIATTKQAIADKNLLFGLSKKDTIKVFFS